MIFDAMDILGENILIFAENIFAYFVESEQFLKKKDANLMPIGNHKGNYDKNQRRIRAKINFV